MTRLSEDAKQKGYIATAELVYSTAAEIELLLYNKLNDYSGGAKYLLSGRILILLFQRHFNLSLGSAEEALKLREDAAGK